MRLPYRSIESIQPLPSIYTTFSLDHNNTQSSKDSGVNSGTSLIRQVEDGIEVLPFERCNNLSAPILSPDQEEKEVFMSSRKELGTADKPLPRLPGSLWLRMSIRQRILALLCIQLLMLAAIGLALMAAKGRLIHSEQAPKPRTAGDGFPPNHTSINIQRGIFSIPIQLAQQQSSECLSRMNESVAWQCASDSVFQMNILPSPANVNASTVITLGALPNNGSVVHGQQIPDIQPTELVALASPNDDATYYFRTKYDRVVLLKDNDLTSAERPRPQPVMRHPTFQIGESLWRCIFNGTQIEGYIYINQSSTTGSHTGPLNGSALHTSNVPKVPYVVKLVEQRLPDSVSPYCERMIVYEDGSLSSRSAKILLDLTESATELSAKDDFPEKGTSQRRRQASSTRHCRCQWLVQ